MPINKLFELENFRSELEIEIELEFKFEFEFVSFVMATIGGSIVGILPESKFPLTIMDVTRGRFINHDGISP